MKRTQIYITEEEHNSLQTLASQTGKSQSELIREAVDIYLAEASGTMRLNQLRKAKGLWQDREDIPDIRKLRKEFERDYE